jgi:hypothetical protein
MSSRSSLLALLAKNFFSLELARFACEELKQMTQTIEYGLIRCRLEGIGS